MTATSTSAIMPTYGRLAIALSHGQGCRVWDTHGREYLDALAGIAVNTLGHAHPDLVKALHEQAQRLIHCSNYYHIPEQEALAQRIVALAQMGQGSSVFFCNSGLEANEAAIKLARKKGCDAGVAARIVVCERAFHGRSFATLSATGNAKIHAGFTPLMPGFERVPYNDIAAIERLDQPSITAVLMETVQGEGGIHAMRLDYLQALRALCDERGWLLMLDEVQCGVGRTGKWFAWQWADAVLPDVMTLAKGLGSGVPVGALVAGPKASGIFAPGNHGSTFGGNALAMRAGLVTLDVVQRDNLLAHALAMGERLLSALRQGLTHVAGLKEIRGSGLMIGIELDRPCAAVLELALEHALLLSVTAECVVRLLPPLIVSAAEIDAIAKRTCAVIRQFLQA